MSDVKFCGLTRETDALEAARLGANYAGFILTASPRRLDVRQAERLAGALRGSATRTVAVFGNEDSEEILAAARHADVDVVQLHGDRIEDYLPQRLREDLGVEIWRVVRVGGSTPRSAPATMDADGVVLDTMSSTVLGGTGRAFDWAGAAEAARQLRRGRRLVVAGGLRPDTVQDAMAALSPDVVDVSSGIESAPGVKDHALMAAFMTAVRAAAGVARP